MTVRTRSSQCGAVSVPLLGLLALGFCFGYGTWRILREWHGRVELQLALDRCVAREAHALRGVLRRLDRENTAIRLARAARVAAAAAAVVAGPTGVGAAAAAQKGLTQTLEAAVALQEAELTAWRARRLAWAVRGGCGWRLAAGRIPWIEALPDWEAPHEGGLHRGPADLLGPQPLTWLDPARLERGWTLGLRLAGRSARGRIWAPGGGARSVGGQDGRWRLEWARFGVGEGL